jgi:hypothetical protein
MDTKPAADTAAAASWVGRYAFSEAGAAAGDGVSPAWDYEIIVSGTKAPWSAHVAVDGMQTMSRIQATGEVVNGQLQLRFDHYDTDNTLPDPSIKKNDVLFTLGRSGKTATLTFGGLKSNLGKKSLEGAVATTKAPCGTFAWANGEAKKTSLAGTMRYKHNKGKYRYVLETNESVCPPFASGESYQQVGLVDAKNRLPKLMTPAGFFPGQFQGTLRKGTAAEMDQVVLELDGADSAVGGAPGL